MLHTGIAVEFLRWRVTQRWRARVPRGPIVNKSWSLTIATLFIRYMLSYEYYWYTKTDLDLLASNVKTWTVVGALLLTTYMYSIFNTSFRTMKS